MELFAAILAGAALAGIISSCASALSSAVDLLSGHSASREQAKAAEASARAQELRAKAPRSPRYEALQRAKREIQQD